MLEVPVGLREMESQARQEALKKFFLDNQLTPPASFGDPSQKEPEVIDVVEVRSNAPFFMDVVLNVRWAPTMDPKPFVVRSNIGLPGAVFVPLIDGQVILVRQFRTPLGVYTWEVPRGFSAAWDESRTSEVPTVVKSETLPKGFVTAVRELGEEVITDATRLNITHLGDIAENSGTTTTSPAYFLIDIQGGKLGGTEGLKVKSVPLADWRKLIGKEVRDNHSIVALSLAAAHVGV